MGEQGRSVGALATNGIAPQPGCASVAVEESAVRGSMVHNRGMSGSLEQPLYVGWGVVIPVSELRWAFTRSSGPGGQGVNTTDSRVELRWSPSDSVALTPVQAQLLQRRLGGQLQQGSLRVVASEQRSQHQNRRSARIRLARLVQGALLPSPKRRRPTRPSRSSVARRVAAKQRRSQVKAHRRKPGHDD